MSGGLDPVRETHCLPEYLDDFKHHIHCSYGEVIKIEPCPTFGYKVTWREGVDRAPNRSELRIPRLAELALAEVDDPC